MSATETQTKFQVTSFDELEPHRTQEGRQTLNVRRKVGIQSFGVGAYATTAADIPVVVEHDETSPAGNQHEELYAVVAGHATFTVDGEEIDAPAGTLVFVADPTVKRGAVAKVEGTRVLAIGGTPGKAWRMSAGEASGDWYGHYEKQEYEQGREILESTLADYPGNAFLHYNIACCESLLGRKDEALENLALAVAAHEPFVALARDDKDFDPIREDSRFAELVA